MSTLVAPPPVTVTGRLDAPLSRWLWLVKWLLALPHYLVLAVLWPVLIVTTVVAAFGILLTGSYPRSLFELNAGVLRWTWRVNYYSYGALATDRYPPFTLADVEDYPARLQIDYPEHLSRGLVLVKWWLLALPHYLVLALLLGGGWWFADDVAGSAPGLIGLLVLVAGVVLAFSGRYPAGLFDLIVGLNRWVLRVAAYAGLMTDSYPPFRLDQGGEERGVLAVRPPVTPPAVPPAPRSSTGGTVAIVLGALLLLPSLGLLAAGSAMLWADQTQRDGAGFVTSSEASLSSSTAAVVTEPLELGLSGPDVLWLDDLLGDVRLRVTSDDDVFVGVARTADVERYLSGVAYDVVQEIRGVDDVSYQREGGSRPATPPGAQEFWLVSSAGSGTRTLVVEPESGSWTAVVMRADGAAGVDAVADVGAEAPALPALAGGLLGIGALLTAVAVVLLAAGARSLSKQETR